MSNPLLQSFISPPFEKIEVHHFEEAVDLIYEEIEDKFQKLKSNFSKPTFENTVVPLDTIFQRLIEASMILGTFNSCKSNQDLLDFIYKSNKRHSDVHARIFQDRAYAAKINSIYSERENLDLDREDLWLLECQLHLFEDAGAFLSEVKQKEILQIELDLIDAVQEFNKNLQSSRLQQAVHIEDLSRLGGIPENVIKVLAHKAKIHNKNGWLIIPERRFIDRLLQVTSDRSLRKEMLEALNKLGLVKPYDNRPVIKKIQTLRHKKALLLGYNSHAAYQVSKSMAGRLIVTEDFLQEYEEQIRPIYEHDMKLLQEWTLDIGGSKLEPWDVLYYKELYKNAKFQFDEELISEYLELGNVLNGWIEHAEKSLNLEISEAAKGKYQTWHMDVIVYEVTDNDNGQSGLLLIDLYQRKGKRVTGIWANLIQQADPSRGKMNIVLIGMDLVNPIEGHPTLLRARSVIDLFHEGGHALNFLKSGYTKYWSRSAYENKSDFSEIHSHLEENFAFHPDVVKTYGCHYQSSELIPDDLLALKLKSNSFLSSLRAMMILQSSLYDLAFHKVTSGRHTTYEAVQEDANIQCNFNQLINPITLCRFHYIFRHPKSLYSGSFWQYIWSEVAQAQVFQLFKDQGLYDPSLLNKKRAFFASGSKDRPQSLYSELTGNQSRDIQPLLDLKYGHQDELS